MQTLRKMLVEHAVSADGEVWRDEVLRCLRCLSSFSMDWPRLSRSLRQYFETNVKASVPPGLWRDYLLEVLAGEVDWTEVALEISAAVISDGSHDQA